MKNIDSEIILEVDSLGKKFSKSLKKSLYYGAKDILSELTDVFLPSRNNLSKKSVLRKCEFWALKNINFKLRRGEILGIVGQNGAGKTTLLKLINGLISPDEGTIKIKGSIGALIALGAGFNPILSGRENLYMNASILGFKRREIDLVFDEIIEFSELREFIDSPVMNYSSGMKARLGFSIASFVNADLLLVDEILSVGDLGFREKSFNRMSHICRNGSAAIFISHNTAAILSICTKVIWFKKGQIFKAGQTDKIMSEYMQEQKQEYLNKLKHESSVTQNREREKYGVNNCSVEITDVFSFNSNSSYTNEFITGENIGLKIFFNSTRNNSDVNFVIHITLNNEILLVSDMLRDSKPVSLKEGKYCMECIFTDIPLLSNFYIIKTFALGKTPIEKIAWPPFETSFIIKDNVGNHAMQELRKPGIIKAEADFKLLQKLDN